MGAQQGPGRTFPLSKALIIAALIVAVGTVLTVKQRAEPVLDSPPVPAREAVETPADSPASLPRLVDLGSDRCQSCKAMEPVLEALTSEYEGRLEVLFIDVWKEPEEAERYGIQLIPTQIFFDSGGRELFRNEGFFSKEDILAKWKDLGFDFDG
jgi:thioredoxin 1